MKNYLVSIAMTFVVYLSLSSLFAEHVFYLGGEVGGNFQTCRYLAQRHCSFGGGYNLGMVGGYVWRRCLSLETEASYRNNPYRLNGSTESGDPKKFHGQVDTWSFMANGYYDIPLSLCNISPYIGGGIGWDLVHQSIKISHRKYKGDHDGFAWQLMAGFSYSFCTNYAAKLEYKYHLAPIRHNQHIRNQSVVIGIQRFFCSAISMVRQK